MQVASKYPEQLLLITNPAQQPEIVQHKPVDSLHVQQSTYAQHTQSHLPLDGFTNCGPAHNACDVHLLSIACDGLLLVLYDDLVAGG